MVYMRIHEQDSLEGIYVTDWQGVIIMPTILVDYENVNGSNGLKGTDVLCRDDTLIIFYSKNCGKIRYDYIQEIKESGCGIYIDLEAQILQNIARHLQGWEQPIDTDRWLMQKLAEIGKLNQENIRLIAKMSGLSQTAAERMLNAAAEDAIKSLDPGLRYLA